MANQKFNKGEIVIYQTSKKEVELKVRLERKNIWLDTHQMARVFDVNRPAIVKHINNIYKTGELDKKSTCSILEQVAADGKEGKFRELQTAIAFLKMIIFTGKMEKRKSITML